MTKQYIKPKFFTCISIKSNNDGTAGFRFNILGIRAYNPDGKNVPQNNQNFGRRVSSKYKAKGTFFINDGYKAVGRNIKTGRFESLV